MADRPIFTYQTRLDLDAAQAAALDAYATLYGKAERSLFAAIRSGKNMNDLKRAFLSRFGITARQFNAVRIGLEGKIDSIKSRQPELIAELEIRIKQATKVVAKLSLKPSQAAKLHQKKRRLHILQTKLAALQADRKEGLVRLCFGSKKLFNAQFDLAANSYSSHEEWKSDWQASRSNQFFVLGSQDETAGNQSCQASAIEDGTLALQIRLPNAMVAEGQSKSMLLTGLRFAYGQDAILAALASSQRITSTTQAGLPAVKRIGSALSYRFVRDIKGWRVFVSCESPAVAVTSQKALGALGVDINADHLALSEIDRFGNLVHCSRIDLHTYGKTTEQSKALIGDAAVAIVSQAKSRGKPIIVEALNFAKKKAELEATDARYARMLSSFACNKIFSSIKSAAFRAGVEVIEINPAYTSVIGAVKYAQIRGISIHMGAALAIARRGLELSEKPPKQGVIAPTRSGGHITLCVPVRNRKKHKWSQWGRIRTALKAAHVVHDRSGVPKGKPAPLSPAMRALGATWSFTVETRSANRQQHCSAGVLDDVPY